MHGWTARLLVIVLLACLGACAALQPSAQANRPDGEGYAGVGELLVRIRVMDDGTSFFDTLIPRKSQRATVEVRYLGINAAGRAVFQRHDVDLLAGVPVALAPRTGTSEAESGYAPSNLPPDTREILLDLRLAREIRVQGKIIEIVEASPSGVVFRLY